MADMMEPTVEQPETTDSFELGWDDAAESVAADQPEAQTDDAATATEERSDMAASNGAEHEAAEHADTEQTSQNEQQNIGANQPRTWELRHLGESRTVNETDMVALAQKGMDYDRVRSQYDEFKPVMELFNQFANKQGMSTKDYIALIRAQAKQAEGLNEADARRAVELEDREAVVAAAEAERQAQQEAANQAEAARLSAENRRQADIEEFRKTFPEAAKDPGSIPQQVWDAVRGGSTLVAAYARFAVQEAKQEAAAMRQSHINEDRSTGSMKSAGSGLKAKDAFLEGWGD